ncbi:hypothetical protein HD599_000132 [Conyzicola lurida]|uniref:Uncharacterized protein n=1 Tax=Conyzicola lurida TaxID=1172621 RepID=A0A841AK34_9MICO|nr:hypothetical protein [Conyzicola lurida]MBB5841809.1 hypothetical protein [Conyzicola lurida]
MSPRSAKEANLVLGASPRVNLLPPEVADRKRDASIRRSVVFGIIGAVLISAAGYGFASWKSIETSDKLAVAQEETTSLLAQQNEFAEVRNLAQQKATIDEALIVGASTEIDWKSYYEKIMASLPAGMVLDSFVADSKAPVEGIAAVTAPTQADRDATISFSMETPNFGDVDVWLKSLKTLPGYVDATASGIALDLNGFYVASVTLNISSGAYSNRYAAEAEAPAEGAATDETAPDGTTTEGEGTN